MRGERAILLEVYEKMYAALGPRHWWPAETPWEMMVGAVLTQGVAWRNVSRAIENLRREGLLSPQGIYHCPRERLEELIRPALYFRVKARKLHALAGLVVNKYDGDLSSMWRQPWPKLRQELLSVYGIGPETADCILLYAGGFPVFVVDAYTRRIMSRLGLTPENISYDALQEFFHAHLPADPRLFNEYHALLDGVGHRFCNPRRPRCPDCPLHDCCRGLPEGV